MVDTCTRGFGYVCCLVRRSRKRNLRLECAHVDCDFVFIVRVGVGENRSKRPFRTLARISQNCFRRREEDADRAHFRERAAKRDALREAELLEVASELDDAIIDIETACLHYLAEMKAEIACVHTGA